MSDSSTVLVLGARGRLGAAVTQAFAQAGWRVAAQVRPGAQPLPAIPNVRWVQALPWETEALAHAVGHAPVVQQARKRSRADLLESSAKSSTSRVSFHTPEENGSFFSTAMI